MTTKPEKVDAWMPLWIGSYLADTMTLDRHEHGGYLLLLFAYWRNKGPLADDDKDLANVTKSKSPREWRELRARLVQFFEIRDGLWRHGRADEELAKALEHKAGATAKAKKGAQARWEKAGKDASGNAPSIGQAKPRQCPTPSPLPSSLRSDPPAPDPGAGFDGFWNAYPGGPRKAAQSKCLEVWKARGFALIAEEISAHVTSMAKSEQWTKANGQFAPSPKVYLEEERWQAGTEADAVAAQEAEQWHESVKGIVAKGVELGVGAWSEALWMAGTQPDWIAYRSRVYRAAGFMPRATA